MTSVCSTEIILSKIHFDKWERTKINCVNKYDSIYENREKKKRLTEYVPLIHNVAHPTDTQTQLVRSAIYRRRCRKQISKQNKNVTFRVTAQAIHMITV